MVGDMARKDNFNINVFNFIFLGEGGWTMDTSVQLLIFLALYNLLFIHLVFCICHIPIITHPFSPHLLGSMEHINHRTVASLENVCVWWTWAGGGGMIFYTIIIVKLTCFIYQFAKNREESCPLNRATLFDRHVRISNSYSNT